MKQLLRDLLNRIGLGETVAQVGFLRRRGLGYRHIWAYRKIDGWLTENEAIALYDLACRLTPTHPVIVEIGSWLGKSSVILAKGLQGKTNPILYCIDPFDAAGDAGYAILVEARGLQLKEQFIENVKRNNVYDHIRILHGYSYDFAAGFSDEIDFLFIDGNHAYDSVMRDYTDWTPHLKTGGIIALHDVGDNFPGPTSVVKEKVVDNPAWSEVRRVDSLVMASKASL